MPNELTLEQNRSIVDQFIANHLANHYYAYAIHDKAGELSSERHPHVHIMFSERLIDDVERTSERPACKYFRRAAKPLKGEQIASFERRSQHGAPKDPKWHDKKYLCELRADFARIQNEVLAQNGFSIHVDCRTLKAQQETAEKDGDNFLANLYKRMPESYVGILPVQEENESSKSVKRYRRNIQSKQHVLFLADLHQKMVAEFETKLLVRQAEYATFALMDSQAYKSANMDDESLRTLNQEILAGLERIKEVKRYFVGVDRAKEQAERQYLTPADHKFILDYRNRRGQELNLEKLLRELSVLPETYKESQAEFLAIKRVMEKRISDLRLFLSRNHAQYCAIEEKLQNTYRRKNVELVVHSILQRNLEVLNELKKASESILKNVDALRSKLKVRETPQTTFTAKEVRDSLFQQFRSLHRQYEEAKSKYYTLMFKRVSSAEALSRAKNIFVHGGFKKLSIEQKLYEKELARYQREKSENQKRTMDFNSQQWASYGEKLLAQYYLTKSQIQLQETERKLSATKIWLDNESTRLEALCKTDDAKEKIALIAVSILRKNLKIAHEYEDAKKLVSTLSQKLQETKKRFNAFDSGYGSLKKNRVYRVIPSESDSGKTSALKENTLTAIIADALLGEPYAVQLVARFDSTALEMEKD